jgi:hypothetical protein
MASRPIPVDGWADLVRFMYGLRGPLDVLTLQGLGGEFFDK